MTTATLTEADVRLRDTYYGKLAAEGAANRVYGVRAVANDIEVRLRLERTDPDIAEEQRDSAERGGKRAWYRPCGQPDHRAVAARREDR